MTRETRSETCTSSTRFASAIYSWVTECSCTEWWRGLNYVTEHKASTCNFTLRVTKHRFSETYRISWITASMSRKTWLWAMELPQFVYDGHVTKYYSIKCTLRKRKFHLLWANSILVSFYGNAFHWNCSTNPFMALETFQEFPSDN